MATYYPKKGDFIYLDFSPQAGHEQKGRRPALVVSNDLFNEGTGLAIVCPITNTNRNNPFHLPLASASKLTGFVMVEQVKSYDFRARNADFVEQAPEDLLTNALAMLDACLR